MNLRKFLYLINFRFFMFTKMRELSRIENVTIYGCDSADERQLARKRKFDFWFWKYNDGSIIKEDGVAVVEDMESSFVFAAKTTFMITTFMV